MSEKRNKPHASNLCGAKTRAGTPCKNKAMANGRCRMHGGKSTGAKDKAKLKGNKNSEKHGLYSKYFPEETMELFNAFETKDPIEIMWDNIKIQFAMIVRAQRTVDDKELIFNPAFNSNFMEAQSRAMGTLGSMMEQYDKLCRTNMATEEQKARIEKLKLETKKLQIDTSDIDYNADAIQSFIDATTPSEEDISKLFEIEEEETDG